MANTITLGRDIQTGNVVSLGPEERLMGIYVPGSTGTGKSTFLVNLALQDIMVGQGLGFFSPVSDAINDILTRIPPEREKDVLHINPLFTAMVPGLNLFSCPDPTSDEQVALTSGLIMHVFSKVFGVGPDTPRLADVLRTVTITLVESGLTMAEIPLLLLDSSFRSRVVKNVKNETVKLWWQVYGNLRPTEQIELVSSTLNKVNAFLTNPLIARIISQPKSTIDFRSVMDENKILLVELDPRLEDIAELLGTTIIAKILEAAFSRTDTPSQDRGLFALYLDEAQRYATEDLATLTAEARKYGIATVLAHQFRGQLPEIMRGATLNVSNYVVFKIASEDAEMAGIFDTTPQVEVIGREEILVPRKSVLTHLLISGHQSSKVMGFARNYIVPLNLATKEEEVEYEYSDAWGDHKSKVYPLSPVDGTYSFDPKDIEKGLVYLNEFLYLSMTHNHTEAKKAFYEATRKFSQYLGCCRYFNSPSARQILKESAQEKMEKLNQEISEKRAVLESNKAFSDYLAGPGHKEKWYSQLLEKQNNEHFSALPTGLRSFLLIYELSSERPLKEDLPLPFVLWVSYFERKHNPGNVNWYEYEAQYNKVLASFSSAETLISIRRANLKRILERYSSELARLRSELADVVSQESSLFYRFFSLERRSHLWCRRGDLERNINGCEGQVKKYNGLLSRPEDEDTAKELASRCAHFASLDTPQKVIESKMQAYIELEINPRYEKIKAIYEQLQKSVSALDEHIKPEKPRFDAYYLAAMEAALELEANPIMEGSGQYRDITRQVQTHADRQNWIVNKLTHLDRFTAWVKLGKQETVIATEPLPPRRKVNLSDLLYAIRRRNVEEGHLRPVSEVKDELNARRNGQMPQLTSKQRV